MKNFCDAYLALPMTTFVSMKDLDFSEGIVMKIAVISM